MGVQLLTILHPRRHRMGLCFWAKLILVAIKTKVSVNGSTGSLRSYNQDFFSGPPQPVFAKTRALKKLFSTLLVFARILAR